MRISARLTLQRVVNKRASTDAVLWEAAKAWNAEGGAVWLKIITEGLEGIGKGDESESDGSITVGRGCFPKKLDLKMEFTI